MTTNPVFHYNSKHIEVRYHFIRDIVKKGVIKPKYVPTEEQVADVLTKPLSRVKFEYPLSQVKFEYFRDKLGVVQKDLPRKRE